MQETIDQSKKDLDTQADTYFRVVVDFLKWTSTVTIGAMVWIGNNLDKVKPIPLVIAIVALLCLFASLVVAIHVVRRISIAAAKDWSLAIADSAILRNSILKSVLLSIVPAEELSAGFEREERAAKDHKWDALKAAQPFSQPEGFNFWITVYVISLLTGLFLYVFAQILNVVI